MNKRNQQQRIAEIQENYVIYALYIIAAIVVMTVQAHQSIFFSFSSLLNMNVNVCVFVLHKFILSPSSHYSYCYVKCCTKLVWVWCDVMANVNERNLQFETKIK